MSETTEKTMDVLLTWTQHIGFLTLARIERVVEGKHENDSKEG